MIIYVNCAAKRDGDGSPERPFKRIGEAAKIARPGDEVRVAPGTYREYVDPETAGREDARITYCSEEPLGAVITGAEEVKGWVQVQDGIWCVRIPNCVFGDYNPYTTIIRGDWYSGPFVYHTGAVYLNDKMLYEAVTLEECIRGEIH
ncbi:MAG: DUF1565 domain-containing protein, partial [Lachnospiraceae bacterium]|nr:DUF1565 domain-containing protein [Lachnospiraceae bacterium]